VVVTLLVVAIGAGGLVWIRGGGDGGDGGSDGPDVVFGDRPAPPTNLRAKAGAFAVRLSWKAGAGPVEGERYMINRDGEFVDEVRTTRFADEDVLPDTAYRYEVVAIADDDSASARATVKVRTDDAPPATARLEGVFNVRFDETNRFGYASGTGSLLRTLGFRFRPDCDEGSCDTSLTGMRFKGFEMDLSKKGGTYRGSVSFRGFGRCGSTPTTSSFSVTVEPGEARGVDGDWQVTGITGSLSQRAAAQLGCVSAGSDFTFTGRLV
jgi:hypothetical protein